MASVIHTIAIAVSSIGMVLGYGYIIMRVIFEFTRDKRREKTRKKHLDVFLKKRHERTRKKRLDVFLEKKEKRHESD